MSQKTNLSKKSVPSAAIGGAIPPIASSAAFQQKTGIAELDGVLGGGFPKGSIVLVSGNSGTGKTIFAL